MPDQPVPKITIQALHDAVVAGSTEPTDVLIRITMPDPPATQASVRPPVNLALVIDRSGSMSGEKIVRARQAASLCVANMQGRDRATIVSFDDEVVTHIAGATMDQRQLVMAGISQIDVGGSTALFDGWARGASEARNFLAADGVNRVVLITDGQANVGETDPGAICRLVAEAAARGITTSTIGIGSDYNEELLIPMAEAGRGNASHVAEPQELPVIVARELSGLAMTYGVDARLGIEPADNVEIVEVLNDLPRGRRDRLKIGDLAYGATVDVAVRIRVPIGTAGERMPLFSVRLSWSEAAAGRFQRRHKVRTPFEALLVGEGDLDNASTNADVLVAVELLIAARARNRAIALLDRQGPDQAQQTIADALGRIRVRLTEHLARPDVAEEIRSLEQLLDELRHRMDLAGSRKRMRYESHEAMRSRRR